MAIANVLHAGHGFKYITYISYPLHPILLRSRESNYCILYFSGEGTEAEMGHITADRIANKWWGWSHAPFKKRNVALLTLRMCQGFFFKVSTMPQISIRCPIDTFTCY